MLRVSCIEITWLFIHMKYQYARIFILIVPINLVVIITWQLRPMHIWMLQVGMMMLICQLCLLQLLHRDDTDCLRLDLVSSRWVWVAIRIHISLVVVLILIICCPLQIMSVFSSRTPISSWTLTHMTVAVIKTCSLYNCYTFKQILIIELNKMPSF